MTDSPAGSVQSVNQPQKRGDENDGRWIVQQPYHECAPPRVKRRAMPGDVWECACGQRWTIFRNWAGDGWEPVNG